MALAAAFDGVKVKRVRKAPVRKPKLVVVETPAVEPTVEQVKQRKPANDVFGVPEKWVMPSDAAIAAAKEFLLSVNNKQTTTLNQFTYVTDDGKLFETHKTAPCYATFAYPREENRNEKEWYTVFADRATNWYESGRYGQDKRPKPLDKAHYDYVHWVANESPFSYCFITKDPEEIVSVGSLFNTNYPAVHLISAAMSIRYLSEKLSHIERWHKFLEYTDKDTAFLLIHLMDKSRYKNSEYTFGYGIGGHAMLDYVNRENFRNFRNHDFISTSKCKPTRIKPGGYAPLHKLWYQTKSKKEDFKFNYDMVRSEEAKEYSWSSANMKSFDAKDLSGVIDAIIKESTEGVTNG